MNAVNTSIQWGHSAELEAESCRLLKEQNQLEQNFSKIYKIIETLSRTKQGGYDRLIKAIVPVALKYKADFGMRSKSQLILLASQLGQSYVLGSQDFNGLIRNIEDSIDRIDEATVLLLNQAFQNLDLNHMNANRTFKTLNDGVIGQIEEKAEFVDTTFLIRFMSTFFMGKRKLNVKDAEKLGRILADKIERDPHSVRFSYLLPLCQLHMLTGCKHAEITDIIGTKIREARSIFTLTRDFGTLPLYFRTLNREADEEKKTQLREQVLDMLNSAIRPERPNTDLLVMKFVLETIAFGKPVQETFA